MNERKVRRENAYHYSEHLHVSSACSRYVLGFSTARSANTMLHGAEIVRRLRVAAEIVAKSWGLCLQQTSEIRRF